MKSTNDRYQLKLSHLTKHFGRTLLFTELSSEVNSGEILGVAGGNGAGKSTLLRIIAGLVRPSAGKVTMYHNGESIPAELKRKFIGMVAPAFSLYDELTARENLIFFARARGNIDSPQVCDELLQRVGLSEWADESYGIFSSGMKQRLKIAQAVLHRPPLLLLDEPFDNLDVQGFHIVESIILDQKKWGLTVIASNEQREFEYADHIIHLSQ